MTGNLGDRTRRTIFERLADRAQTVGELAAELPVSRPAVSQHLKLLKDAVHPGSLITPITTTTEVDRPPEDVFVYVTDPARFSEWQRNVVGGHMDADGPTTVGTKCLTTRRIGFAERAVTAEVTHIAPPRRWGVRGIDGPIRAIVNVTVDPLDEGRRSRLTIDIDFEGHGIGRLLVPLAVRRQVRNEMPANLRSAKERLEQQR